MPLVVAAHRVHHLHHRRRSQRRLREINLAALARLGREWKGEVFEGLIEGRGSECETKINGGGNHNEDTDFARIFSVEGNNTIRWYTHEWTTPHAYCCLSPLSV